MSNSGNQQWRPLECIRKSTALTFWWIIFITYHHSYHPPVMFCSSCSMNAIQNMSPGPLLHCCRSIVKITKCPHVFCHKNTCDNMTPHGILTHQSCCPLLLHAHDCAMLLLLTTEHSRHIWNAPHRLQVCGHMTSHTYLCEHYNFPSLKGKRTKCVPG